MRRKRKSKPNKLKCVYCKRYLDTSKPNYGWHYNKEGNIEKCCFSNMSMQVTTTKMKFNKKELQKLRPYTSRKRWEKIYLKRKRSNWKVIGDI